jgi:hypothetical protein
MFIPAANRPFQCDENRLLRVSSDSLTGQVIVVTKSSVRGATGDLWQPASSAWNGCGLGSREPG